MEDMDLSGTGESMASKSKLPSLLDSPTVPTKIWKPPPAIVQPRVPSGTKSSSPWKINSPSSIQRQLLSPRKLVGKLASARFAASRKPFPSTAPFAMHGMPLAPNDEDLAIESKDCFPLEDKESKFPPGNQKQQKQGNQKADNVRKNRFLSRLQCPRDDDEEDEESAALPCPKLLHTESQAGVQTADDEKAWKVWGRSTRSSADHGNSLMT